VKLPIVTLATGEEQPADAYIESGPAVPPLQASGTNGAENRISNGVFINEECTSHMRQHSFTASYTSGVFHSARRNAADKQ
jgi:hypothetical protein